MWIIDINGEDPITAQSVLYELNCHQTPRGKSKVNINLCRRNSYKKTDLEDICSIFDQVRPIVSHLEVRLPDKLPTPNNIGECLEVPHRQLRKEDLFVQYEKNKNAGFISATIKIKSLPEVTKFLYLLFSPSIKEYDCSDAYIFVTHHCENGISIIKGIGFYIYYSSVAHAESFRIDIAIADMHIFTDRILDVSNEFQNTDVSIHESFYVSPPPYYIYWF